MTKYNPTIRLTQESYDIIKWFTHNWDNEVGALGIGEMRDGELCVDKLVFPKQTVNGVHVHFKPEDWGPIIQELSDEEISKIIFYWHKHPPGSATASQGDEDDTFDVFMDKDSGRDFFGFLITSEKGNEMIYTARIEMRTPVWASLEDAELVTDSDDSIKELCEKIIKDKITVGSASASQQPGVNGIVQQDFQGTLTGSQTYSGYYDYGNDCVLTVSKRNGQLIIEASDYFDEWICEMIDTEMANHIANSKVDIGGNGLITYTLQPKKKKLRPLYKHFKELEAEMGVYEEEEGDEKMASSHRNNNYEDYDYYGAYRNVWGY